MKYALPLACLLALSVPIARAQTPALQTPSVPSLTQTPLPVAPTQVTLNLVAPGNYVIHAAYGFAGATKRVSMQSGSFNDRLTVSAGALKLSGAVADSPIPVNRLSFSVYVPIGSNSEAFGWPDR